MRQAAEPQRGEKYTTLALRLQAKTLVGIDFSALSHSFELQRMF